MYKITVKVKPIKNYNLFLQGKKAKPIQFKLIKKKSSELHDIILLSSLKEVGVKKAQLYINNCYGLACGKRRLKKN